MTHTLTPVVQANEISFSSATLSDDRVATLIQFFDSSRATAYVTSNASPEVIANYHLADTALHITINRTDGTALSFAVATNSFNPSKSYVLLKARNTILTIPPFKINLED